MSNLLPPSATFATRGILLPPVAGPASASAFVLNSFNPDQKKPLLEPVLSRAAWDFLLLERVCIMEESGILPQRAFALAQADTTSIHGHRPEGGF